MSDVRVALVCEGDASRSEVAFSGTAKRLFYALREKGYEMLPVDASLGKVQRVVAAGTSFSADRARWRSKFRYGLSSGRMRAAAAKRSLGSKNVDAVVQIGATFDPPLAGSVPYAIFADWNMALSRMEAAEGRSGKGLTQADYAEIDADHRRIYAGAAVIFTISERLRQSFIELYGAAPERVITAYAGPNFGSDVIARALAAPKQSTAPTVLFIAKEFKRKGGPAVAAAFAKIQAQVPDARLLFAGAETLPVEFAGLKNVEHLGLLDKTVPEQLERLMQAYRDADVLVLPSVRDPFPTVIREAMFMGVPCVASNIWAMPEMIVEGETGFLVEPGDADALAERCVRLLTDRALNERFGAAAKARAAAMFSWEAVGDALDRGLKLMVGR